MEDKYQADYVYVFVAPHVRRNMFVFTFHTPLVSLYVCLDVPIELKKNKDLNIE